MGNQKIEKWRTGRLEKGIWIIVIFESGNVKNIGKRGKVGKLDSGKLIELKVGNYNLDWSIEYWIFK